MDDPLRIESERLARSWDQYEPGKLREYLVASVEDPRINIQSILTRHFLLAQALPSKFESLKTQELIFAGAFNWVSALARNSHPDDWRAILHALDQGADNAEGIDLPAFTNSLFRALPAQIDGAIVPNYLRDSVSQLAEGVEPAAVTAALADTFAPIWGNRLGGEASSALQILELACGSANDYRFIHRYGIARHLRYTGIDISQKNIANSIDMFPGARFQVGNAIQLELGDQSMDACFFHDLLEHLSLEALDRAVSEICRVARRSICAGLFSAWEGPDHIVRPMDEYHCNTLSLARLGELFRRNGFAIRSIHVDSYVRKYFHPLEYHNPHAYTVYADRES